MALVLAAALSVSSLFMAGGKSAKADTEKLSGLNGMEITDKMGLGWNLGNTLDATGGSRDDVLSHEQSWGNPVVTKELIQGVKAEGFNTIRIPTTWYNYMDENYNIDQKYMDRVKEIVGWAYDEGMFIILNVHHEKWVNDKDIDKNYVKIGYELAAVWKQIAENFADFDQHLIFEGMNEPRAAGTGYEWGGNNDCYAAVNYLDQVFVNAVRMSDKGYNKERALMIPGYAASSSSSVMNSISLPTYDGKVCNNLIISVHCYSPYDFCLSDNVTDFDPQNSQSTGGIDVLFDEIDSIFLSHDIPVVIGETSATAKNNVEARERWAGYMAEKSAGYGVPIVIWDNGSDSNQGGESHAHMNRQTNKANYPTVFAALFDGYKSVEIKSMRNKGGNEPAGSSEAAVIWSDEAGNESDAQWDISFVTLASKPTYYISGRDIVFEYTGNGEPKIILDSEVKQQWWIPVDPAEIYEKNGKKYARFTSDSIKTEIGKYGISDPSELRNLCFIAANDNITGYSASVSGGDPVVTYVVNGVSVIKDSGMPEDPSFTNMKFLGWYSEKDYREGSEYTGGTPDHDMTVYAKFEITGDALSDPDKGSDAKSSSSSEKDDKPAESAKESSSKIEESSSSSESSSGDSSKESPDGSAGDSAENSSDGNKGIVSTVLIILGVLFLCGGIVWAVFTFGKRKES